MRKLKLQVQISIDGFIAGPAAEMDWLEWNWGEDIANYVTALTEPVDTIVMGRKLAEGFIPHWEAAAKSPEHVPGAEKMSSTPKIVFSHTLEKHDWPNTTLAHNPEAVITALKETAGGDIIAYGGASFVSHLIEKGLVDEFFLFANPAALGSGMPIFAGLQNPLTLNLVEAVPFGCGITVLRYTL